MSRPFPRRSFQPREPLHRRNGKIRAREVRVLDENKQQLGVMSLNEALRLAQAKDFDLVVNASPLGMRVDDPMPIDLEGLTAEAIVGDVVISRELTPVLKAARALGCHVQPGSVMTDHQGEAMAHFLGLETGDWSPAAIRAALGD